MRQFNLSAAITFLALAVSLVPGSVRAQATGNAVSYPAGTALVAGPPGTDFSMADGTLSTMQTGDHGYESVQPSAGTKAGFGYWAQFDAPASVQLSPGSDTAYTAPALSGQWILIGDPSGTLPATVTGASATYTYDSAHGYQQATLLQPGQGAWALGGGAGAITVAPQTAAAAAASASLKTFTGAGFQIGIPTGWDRASLGSDANSQEWSSGDGRSSLYLGGPLQIPAGTPINAVRLLTALESDSSLASFSLSNAQIAVSVPAAAITLQGADAAAQATWTVMDPQAGQVQCQVVVAVSNNNLYYLILGGSADDVSQNQALFQQIIQSFQLTS